MKVKLKYKWFSPSEGWGRGGSDTRVMSGKMYSPGVHEIPEYMRQHLPTSAEIIDDPADKPKRMAPAPKKVEVKVDSE